MDTTIKTCGRNGCSEPVKEVNSKTGKLYYYCEWHRQAKKTYSKKYYENNKDKINRTTLERYHKLRDDVIKMYGESCSCCGENERSFLALDHVEGAGQKRRQERSNFGVYQDALDACDPKRFRILCHNCNNAIYHCGICPHQIN